MRLTVNKKIQGEGWLLENTLLIKNLSQWPETVGIEAYGLSWEVVCISAPVGHPLANSILAAWGNGPKDGQDFVFKFERGAMGELIAKRCKW